MKKAIPIVFLLAAAAATGAWFGLGDKDGASKQTKNADTVYVDSVGVITGVGNYGGLATRYAGVAETQEEWGVRVEGERKVKETFVKAGDVVKAGDKLFEYDTAADEQAIEKNRIELAKFANDIDTRNRKIEALRQQETQAKTEEELLTVQTQILEEENGIKQDEYEARTTQADMDNLLESTKDSLVCSEIDGVVKKVSNPSQDENSSYSSSQDDDQNFITITAVGDLRIKGYANEQNVDSISEGDQLIAFSRADETKWWKGIITVIKRDGDDSKNENSGFYGGSSSMAATKYPFYVELEDVDGLKLGQHVYLEADIGQTTGDSSLWLYEYYIQEDEQGTFVWAEAKDGKVIERRAVEIGDRDESSEKVKVESGLDISDKIAVPGQDPKEGAPTSEVDYDTSEDESEWGDWNSEWEDVLSQDNMNDMSDFYGYEDFNDNFGSDDDFGDDSIEGYGDDYSDDYSGDFGDDFGDDEEFGDIEDF